MATAPTVPRANKNWAARAGESEGVASRSRQAATREDVFGAAASYSNPVMSANHFVRRHHIFDEEYAGVRARPPTNGTS